MCTDVTHITLMCLFASNNLKQNNMKNLTDSQKAIIECLEMEFLNINGKSVSGGLLDIGGIMAAERAKCEAVARIDANNKMWDDIRNDMAVGEYGRLVADLEKLNIPYVFLGTYDHQLRIGKYNNLLLRIETVTKQTETSNTSTESETIGLRYKYRKSTDFYGKDYTFDTIKELCDSYDFKNFIQSEYNSAMYNDKRNKTI